MFRSKCKRQVAFNRRFRKIERISYFRKLEVEYKIRSIFGRFYPKAKFNRIRLVIE